MDASHALATARPDHRITGLGQAVLEFGNIIATRTEL